MSYPVLMLTILTLATVGIFIILLLMLWRKWLMQKRLQELVDNVDYSGLSTGDVSPEVVEEFQKMATQAGEDAVEIYDSLMKKALKDLRKSSSSS